MAASFKSANQCVMMEERERHFSFYFNLLQLIIFIIFSKL